MKNFLYSKISNLKNLKKNSLNRYSKKFENIFRNLNSEIQNKDMTLNILSKKFKLNFELNDLKKFKKFKNIAIIGMGGSILGVKATKKFLEKKIKKNIIFFDNINESQILKFKKKENFKKILFIVISKSGNTIETLSILLSLNVLKKNAKNIIIISEKKNNLLHFISQKFNLFFLEHKSFVGGRYSVLSEVGLAPAYLMGLDIFKLRSNLQIHLKGKGKKYIKNISISLSKLLSGAKVKNLIFLNYAPELEDFLYWCQQLISESLGKDGKGFLPSISSAPKDHHSLLQLYLDGPRDKLFYIFSYDRPTRESIKFKEIPNFINFYEEKTITEIKNAQKDALLKTLKKNKIPFREFKIKSLDERILGELFSYFILETIIIGKLTNVNPFDQPAVEQVKILTKQLLD